MQNSSRRCYIGLLKKDDGYGAYASAFDPSRVIEILLSPNQDHPSAARDADTSALTFAGVFSSFLSIMESYRKFIPIILGAAPVVSTMLAARRIERFTKAKGSRHCLSKDNVEIYEFDMSAYSEFAIHRDEISTAFEGARHTQM